MSKAMNSIDDDYADADSSDADEGGKYEIPRSTIE